MITAILAGSLLISPGISGSNGLGEQDLAPAARIVHESSRLEASALWNGAAKVETGSGYFIRGDLLAKLGPVSLGPGYTYHSGGEWSKHVAWAVAAIDAQPQDGLRLRVAVRRELTDTNGVLEVEGSLRASRGRLFVEPGIAWVSYRQGGERHSGVAAVVWVGIDLGGGM